MNSKQKAIAQLGTMNYESEINGMKYCQIKQLAMMNAGHGYIRAAERIYAFPTCLIVRSIDS